MVDGICSSDGVGVPSPGSCPDLDSLNIVCKLKESLLVDHSACGIVFRKPGSLVELYFITFNTSNVWENKLGSSAF